MLSVVKLRVDPADAPAVLGEAAAVLGGESKDRPGFLAGDILVSHDRKTIVILTEWVDRHAWSQSRYHSEVGEMLEHALAASHAIEFEVYDRHARFAPPTA